MDGKYILPSGVLKIMEQIKGEIDVIETASPAVVTVRVLHQQTGNPRFIFAEDLETKKKVVVSVPKRQKDIINQNGKRLKVNKGELDGQTFYRYPVR
jgi:short-subunit dehydrogenase involved in D-alanine esterification of teichoic acids